MNILRFFAIVCLAMCVAPLSFAQNAYAQRGFTSDYKDPVLCSPTQSPLHLNLTDNVLKRCSADNTWTAISGVPRTSLTGVSCRQGEIAYQSLPPAGPHHCAGNNMWQPLDTGNYFPNASLPGHPVIAGGRVNATTGVRNLVFSDFNQQIAPTMQSYAVVGATTFSGFGSNDCIIGGIYSGASAATYCVKITGTGTPNTASWGTDANCTNVGSGNLTTALSIGSGLIAYCTSTTGHSSGDKWSAVISTFSPVTAKNAAGTVVFEIRNDGTAVITLPTSCTGLPSGSLRNNSGTIAVCP